jgi:hypothetical protein
MAAEKLFHDQYVLEQVGRGVGSTAQTHIHSWRRCAERPCRRAQRRASLLERDQPGQPECQFRPRRDRSSV